VPQTPSSPDLRTHQEPRDLSSDEVRAHLEKVLASATFVRSERSQKFLQYVCDLTLRGEGSRINQYLIGSEVFQRGAGYSTDEDSLVRRQAHLLRQKLDTYYAREGQLEPIRIELPVGHYVPVFRRQLVETPPEVDPAVVNSVDAKDLTGVAPPSSRFRLLFALTAGLALFTLGWIFGRQTSRAPAGAQLPPAVQEIWGSWFANDAGPLICISNPMTTVVKYIPDPRPESLLPGHLAVAPGQEKALRDAFNLHDGGTLSLYPSRVNTKIGESLGSALLAVFFTKASVPVRVTQSRLLSWEDLRTQDSILLGNNEGNPWLDPLLAKSPFRLSASTERRRNIVNTSPREGEASTYEVGDLVGKNAPTQEFALVSMLRGLDSRRRLLLINGLNTQATQMATELLTDPDRVQQLLARLKLASPNHRGDWYFQVVIRTEVRDKVPISGPEIIALRVL
jgi:hypothetical protein